MIFPQEQLLPVSWVLVRSRAPSRRKQLALIPVGLTVGVLIIYLEALVAFAFRPDVLPVIGSKGIAIEESIQSISSNLTNSTCPDS
jgi:hypothetical protein